MELDMINCLDKIRMFYLHIILASERRLSIYNSECGKTFLYSFIFSVKTTSSNSLQIV